jgi:uncharacterized protein (TIRG00374 family)
VAAIPGRLASLARGRKAGLLIRLVVGLSLLAFVVSLADLDQIKQVISRIDYPYFWAAVFLVMVDRVAMAYKWGLLLNAKKIVISFWRALEIYLISGFVGVVLPSGVGADIYRVYYTSRPIGKLGHIASSVIVERFLGMAAAAIFAVIGLGVMSSVAKQPVVQQEILTTMFVTLALLIAVFAVSMTTLPFQIAERLLVHWKQPRFAKKLASFREAYHEYARFKMTLFVFFLLSVAEQGLFVLITYVSALAIDIRIDISYFLGIVPVCQIVKRIPISINSLGVQEGLFVYFFGQIGVSATEALSLSILTRIAQWSAMLAGGVLYVMDTSMRVDARSLPAIKEQ